MELFDSHAHLDDKKFDTDRQTLIEQIKQSKVTKLISAGYNLESSKKAIELAKKYNFIYATIGISPNDIPNTNAKLLQMLEQIEKLVEQSQKIVAIGEIGLDYHWNQENKELQKQAFIKQIELANKLQLPIVIHTREATIDTIEILKENKVEKKGVFHCCPLNQELVKQALDLGFYISFAGPITFKNAKNADQIIQKVPNEKMLIETDSPYLCPEPFRGKRNDSRNVEYIAKKIADVKNMKLEEVAQITYHNAEEIFLGAKEK